MRGRVWEKKSKKQKTEVPRSDNLVEVREREEKIYYAIFEIDS